MSDSDFHHKLVERLRQSGFDVARRKGGHSIFKKEDGTGPIVVVPHAIASRNLAKKIAGQAGIELRL
jgi:predicted RNA binding protein YcfA (HicA-like mRNA interferase family)